MNWNVKRFSMLNISQVILVRTDSNLCRKELTVHWITPNSLIRSYLQPCTNSMWGDESEAVAPIIWLYQTVDARKEEVFFPDLLITLRRHEIFYNGRLGPIHTQFNSIISLMHMKSFLTHGSAHSMPLLLMTWQTQITRTSAALVLTSFTWISWFQHQNG